MSKPYVVIVAGSQHGFHPSISSALAKGREVKDRIIKRDGENAWVPIEVHYESPSGGIERVHEE